MTEDGLRPPAVAARRVGVLADDLIWATRLVDLVTRAGAVPVRLRSAAALAEALPALDGCLVDLTARTYDGTACLRIAQVAGVPTAAAAQHDDVVVRRAALDAGAARVWAYRALAEQGDHAIGAWIGGLAARAAGAT